MNMPVLISPASCLIERYDEICDPCCVAFISTIEDLPDRHIILKSLCDDGTKSLELLPPRQLLLLLQHSPATRVQGPQSQHPKGPWLFSVSGAGDPT